MVLLFASVQNFRLWQQHPKGIGYTLANREEDFVASLEPGIKALGFHPIGYRKKGSFGLLPS
jgi:hypothetical protein